MVTIAQFVTTLVPGREKWMLICYEKFTIKNEVKMEEVAKWDGHTQFCTTHTRALGMDGIKEVDSLGDDFGLEYLVATTGCAGIDNWEKSRAVVTIKSICSYNLDIATTSNGRDMELENHAELNGCTGGVGVEWGEGPMVSLVASGDGEICILADVLGRISMELKRQLKTKTEKENRHSMELFGLIPRRKKIEPKPKPIERPPVDPVNQDEIEPEELDATQWEIIKRVETAHARSFCKLANQNEVENG